MRLETNCMTPQADQARHKYADQRGVARSRERFETAKTLLAPLLEHEGDRPGAAYFRALGKLHDHFPDLSQAELEALVVSTIQALNRR